MTTTFSYEPYGTTTQSGTGSGNTLQYAGRENDGTGLYFNRARYYSPANGRFISEDPLGFAAGSNLYAYVGGNPMSNVDPFGLTQCDIDTARRIAADSQPDLSFPDSYGSQDLGYTSNGRRIVGLTIPHFGTILSNFYQQTLTNAQAADLLNTIIHEGIHYTYDYNDPRQRENDNKGTGYPYSEANRRTTKSLIDKFNSQRACLCRKN